MRPHAALALAAALAVPVTARADRERAGTREPAAGDAPFACGKPGARFAVQLKDEIALPELVTWAMGFSCKRFVYTSGLASRSAKLTMITPGKLDAGEAWAVFEVGLEAMGLAAVPKGGVLEIVEAAGAKDAALAIRRGFPEGGGGPVRLLLRPAHVAVDDLRAALELVKSRNGVVTPLANLRALLVTDDGRHVARMKTLVDELDQPGDGAGVWAVPVTHRDAVALVDVLTSMLAPDAASTSAARPPRLVADRRVNTIFAVGSAADHARVASLVAALDRDQGDDAQMTAVRLRNARAVEVVAALQPLVNGGSQGQAAGAAAAVAGPVRLAADDGTNAVLVLASARDTLAVRAMLDELDAPRRQIYLEAMVLEVSSTRGRDLGVAWHAGADTGSTDASGLAFGGLQGSGLSSVVPGESVDAIGAGFLGGLIGTPLSSTVLGDTIPSLGVLLEASATSSEVEVLASPHIMTLDNKTATISVGANIPYKSRNAATSELVPGGGQQIERQKVALTLQITPHIAPAEPGAAPGDERIRLDIDLEHNQLGDSDFGGLGPTWKERSLETTVVLRDQDNLVLGGLIDERVENVTDGIPVLADLPLLGALFRSSRKLRTKSNLLIVITPHLIDDSAAGRALFDRRMREREEFLRARSALTTQVAAPDVDYRRKRGLVAEIDATVRAVERERERRGQVQAPAQPRGRVDQPADRAE